MMSLGIKKDDVSELLRNLNSCRKSIEQDASIRRSNNAADFIKLSDFDYIEEREYGRNFVI